MVGPVSGFFLYLLDFLFPGRCLICGADTGKPTGYAIIPAGWPEGTVDFFGLCNNNSLYEFGDGTGRILCSRCLFSLEPAPLGVTGIVKSIDGISMTDLISPFFINDTLLEVIHALKFRGIRSAAPFLAWWMSLHLRNYIAGASLRKERTVIVPVPLHASRKRERGYNQAELLARSISKSLRIPLEANVLLRKKKTRRQSDLPSDERMENVKGAFELRSHDAVKNRYVLLVDDLVTTGSTVLSCMETLSEAGHLGVAVLCAGRSRRTTTAPPSYAVREHMGSNCDDKSGEGCSS